MITARKLLRNNMKKGYQKPNKALRKLWNKHRIEKVGEVAYMLEYNRTTKSHKTLDEIYA